MTSGNWMNNDGLYLQYGTSKAVPTTMGDFLSYGESREIEFTITLANLTTTAAILGNTTFLSQNVYIDSITTIAEVAATGGTSVSIGTMKADRSTVISATALLNAQLLASHDGQGETNTYTIAAAAGGGNLVGTATTSTTIPDGFAYITALCAGTYTAGVLRVRIRYRGFGTITQ